jgi:hypothetical protein
MIKNILSQIETKIQAEPINDVRKSEILKLLESLKSEIATLEKEHAAGVQAQVALKKSAEELRSSLAGFEQSHPKLVQAVNSISNTLSSFGI